MSEVKSMQQGSEEGVDHVKTSEKKSDEIEWLREHWTKLAIWLASVSTAACYLVGRAWLLGWYDAAGVPSLMFSWSAQDVVIRGLADASTWLVIALGLAGAMIYFMLLDLGSHQISGYSKKVARRLRAEGWSRLSLRRRFATSARKARLQGAADASVLNEHWRTLGKRGAIRLVEAKKKRTRWEPKGSVIFGLIGIALLVGGFGIYMLVLLLYNRPYGEGVRAYTLQYTAATGQWPPQRQPAEWKAEKQFAMPLGEAIAAGREQLRRYAFVRVDLPPDAGKPSQNFCGWLLQGAGSQMVLLTFEGLRVLSFGDAPFDWMSASPDTCSVARSGTTKGARDAH